MSERERRTLARIERHIAETDPRLARMLARHRVPGRPRPVLLLAIGLAAILVGSLTVLVPLVLGGALVSLAALVVAAVRGLRATSTA
ncbi:Protein of unknown function [Pseudonocardia thermophila]|jgi:Protein of unknown function (DUF3040).|uniref:DUF3040 domain-containing protein n=1 Tax=Pseudonocardia thermophila TaxID=1848 RepID=A0A1M6VJ21_PSETH|nr:DUF3040 domain-containing protein [Pseudonocardia thermophila]SHK81364.1 Protein of unknown function [Pseudonocardia thermophila]